RCGDESGRQTQAHHPAGAGLRRQGRRRRHSAQGHPGLRGGIAQDQEVTAKRGAVVIHAAPRLFFRPGHLAFWNCLIRSSPPGTLATRVNSSANDLNVVSISPLYFFCNSSSWSLVGLPSLSIRFLMSPIWSLILPTFGCASLAVFSSLTVLSTPTASLR